jgi:hypothetical protein
MPVKDAKDLHADITKLLLALENLRQHTQNNSADQVVVVDIDGGSF